MVRTAPHPASIAGRTPAQNLDAEGAVLSACFLSTDALVQVRDLLAPEMYYSDDNGRIFEAMCQVVDGKRKVDIVSVAAYLRDRNLLAQVGGPSYLAQLADLTPAVSHVMTHAQIIFDKWRIRSATALCQLTSAEGYGDVGEVQGYLDTHIAGMHALATRNAGSAIEPIGVGLLDALQADWDRVQSGVGLMGIKTGYERLDHKLAGLEAGNLYVVAARPGMGKTALVTGAAVNIVAPEERPELFTPPVEYGVIIFSLEMPRAQLTKRMVCTEARVSLDQYKHSALDADEWKRVFESGAFVSQLPIWIDDTSDITVPQIRAKSRQIATRWCRPPGRDAAGALVAERKIGAVCVDYLQLLKAHERGRSREEEVAAASKGLKQLAKDMGVPVIALSQLNRDVEKRPDKRPTLADLRDSGAVEQDADVVVFIYRDEYYHPEKTEVKGVAELIVAKNRHGGPGKVLAHWNGRITRFGNLDHAAAAAYRGADEGE